MKQMKAKKDKDSKLTLIDLIYFTLIVVYLLGFCLLLGIGLLFIR